MPVVRVLLFLTLLLLPLSAQAANSHGTPDVASEQRAWWGDGFHGYVVSGCAPTVPGASLTFNAFACAGYATEPPSQLHYITQSSAGIGPLNAGAGTYWLALHKNRSGAVGGWTRQSTTHYLWQLNASRPAPPSGALLFAKVTVAGGVITAVELLAPTNPLPYDMVSILDPAFGLSSTPSADASAALQAAITHAQGRCIYLPARTYVIGTALTYNTTDDAAGLCLIGAGMRNTVLDNRVAGGAMLRLNGSVTSNKFQRGGEIRDLSITTTTSPANSHGISIKGAWLLNIQRACIGNETCGAGGSGLTGDGIILDTDLGDADSPSAITIQESEIIGNGGIGIHATPASGISNLSYIRITKNIIQLNAGGGIQFHGISPEISYNAIVQNGGVGGVYIPYNNAGSRYVHIYQNQFDSNYPDQHLKIDAGIGYLIENNEFRFQNVDPPGVFGPTKGIVLGDGTNGLDNVTVRRNSVQSNPSNPSLATTWLTINAANTGPDIIVEDNLFPSFSGANATKFADPSIIAVMREAGRWIRGRLSTLINPGQAGGVTYTPATLDATYHRITIDSGTTIALGEPAGAAQGHELLIDVNNNTGAVISITWHAVYRNVRTMYLPASDRLLCRFFFDETSGNWVAQGRCSSDAWTFHGANGGPALGAIAANSSLTFTTTVNGAATTCTAQASPRDTIGAAFWVAESWVSAANTVTTKVASGAGGIPTDRPYDVVVHCP